MFGKERFHQEVCNFYAYTCSERCLLFMTDACSERLESWYVIRRRCDMQMFLLHVFTHMILQPPKGKRVTEMTIHTPGVKFVNIRRVQPY